MHSRQRWMVGLLLLAGLALPATGCSSGGGGRRKGLQPAGLTAVSSVSGEVLVDWMPVDSATGYALYWSTSPGVTRLTGTRIDVASAPYTHLVPANGTTYHYAVLAIIPKGETDLSAETRCQPLDAPVLGPVTSSTSEVRLEWPDVSGAQAYDLYWSTTPGVTTATGTRIPNVSSGHVHGALPNAVAHHYILLARNSVGGGATSDVSAEASATPIDTPTGVGAGGGNGEVTVTWTPVPGASTHNIYWSLAPGVTRATGTLIADVTTPYVHTGLVNGSTYHYVVTATNATGESRESLEANATPSAPAAPPAPNGVQATPGANQVTVDWLLVATATSYVVYWATSPGVTKATGTPIPMSGPLLEHLGLAQGTTYYYVVTSVGSGGEGPESAEVSATPHVGGTLDPGFGSVGVFTHDAAAGRSSEDKALAIAIDPAGRIVVAGYSTNSNFDWDMVVWRLEGAGVLDTTFNGQGWAVHGDSAGGSGLEVGTGVTTDALGRVFVCGYGPNPSGPDDMIIWVYDANGALDPSFGGTGVVSHDNAAGGNSHDIGLGITRDATGRVLVTGRSYGSGSGTFDMAVWRYDGAGTLDPTFGTGGVFTHHGGVGGNGTDTGESIAVDGSDRIVVAGWSEGLSTGDDMTIWRLEPTGVLDATFGFAGVAVDHGAAGGNSFDAGYDLAVTPPGEIFVGGVSVGPLGTVDMAVWAYDDAGVPVPGFGTAGVYTIDGPIVGSGVDSVRGIALDSLGRLLAAGSAQNPSFDRDMTLLRLTAAGVPDASFGTSGFVWHDNAAGGGGGDYGEAVAIDATGRILVAGYSSANPGYIDMAVWAYRP